MGCLSVAGGFYDGLLDLYTRLTSAVEGLTHTLELGNRESHGNKPHTATPYSFRPKDPQKRSPSNYQYYSLGSLIMTIS